MTVREALVKRLESIARWGRITKKVAVIGLTPAEVEVLLAALAEERPTVEAILAIIRRGEGQ